MVTAEARRAHRHGSVLVTEVRLHDDSVRDTGGADDIEQIKQRVFIRYGQENQAVRLPMPGLGRHPVGERELKGGMSRLCPLEANREVRTSHDVELLARVEVVLVVVHAGQPMTSSLRRQAPTLVSGCVERLGHFLQRSTGGRVLHR